MQKALSVSGLTKTYGNGVKALDDFNLEIEKGDFFALLGANGAGKTSSIGVFTGLINKDSGTVKVFGDDLDEDINAVKAHIGVVPQEFNFSIFEKVIDILVCQAGYFGVWQKEAYSRAEVLLHDLGLWDKRNSTSMSLSGGMKRRLMIARALMHKPRLLILDEPTAGVDVELRYGMWDYLKNLNEQGTSILLTTHYLEEVEQLCRNMAMIRDGKIVAQGSVKKMLKDLDGHSYKMDISASLNGREIEKTKEFDLLQTGDKSLEAALRAGQNISDLVKFLDSQGLEVEDIQTKGNRMEQLFLKLMKS